MEQSAAAGWRNSNGDDMEVRDCLQAEWLIRPGQNRESFMARRESDADPINRPAGSPAHTSNRKHNCKAIR